jgi:hypothetical protein
MYAIKGFHLVRFGTPADQKFLLGNFYRDYRDYVEIKLKGQGDGILRSTLERQ